MIEEVETVPLRGRRAVWDGTNLDEIRELAGDQFAGVQVNAVQLRRLGAHVEFVQPGWSVTRLVNVPEGMDPLVVSSRGPDESPLFRALEPAGA